MNSKTVGRRRLASSDQGSTIPLILGIFLISLLMVAGSVAAGAAFVQQRDLQDMCDGAAVAAAAEAANIDAGRHTDQGGPGFLVLGAVQASVDDYRARDAARRPVIMQASLSNDQLTVAVQCASTTTIAFGAFFGFGHGVHHHAVSTAKARLHAD